MFENGVSFYTTCIAEVEINFPENDVTCRWCRFCYAEKNVNRWKCGLTDRMIYNPNISGLPDFCPLQLKNEKENE